jgi:hypothetical protein
MKRKTPNAQHRTSNAEVKKPRTKSAEWSTVNIECGLHGSRVNDLADSEYGVRRDRRYDPEDRLLDFAVNVVELTESLPNTRREIISLDSFCAAGHRLSPITARLRQQNRAKIFFTSCESV